MNEFIKSDVFFFITSIAVVVLTAILLIALYYIIKILKNVRYISDKAKVETDHLAEDVKELRENVRKEGAKVKHFAGFINKVYKRNK